MLVHVSATCTGARTRWPGRGTAADALICLGDVGHFCSTGTPYLLAW